MVIRVITVKENLRVSVFEITRGWRWPFVEYWATFESFGLR